MSGEDKEELSEAADLHIAAEEQQPSIPIESDKPEEETEQSGDKATNVDNEAEAVSGEGKEELSEAADLNIAAEGQQPSIRIESDKPEEETEQSDDEVTIVSNVDIEAEAVSGEDKEELSEAANIAEEGQQPSIEFESDKIDVETKTVEAKVSDGEAGKWCIIWKEGKFYCKRNTKNGVEFVEMPDPVSDSTDSEPDDAWGDWFASLWILFFLLNVN